ncbi:5'-nucleotidase C-terminal domain-containing protein [Halalkalibacter oceani]|uniref:5'-nucleotidase C-terminal domain-containing protein n=1 Tax=Halalkalibacter oceani TaxID=1653776 RepID=UPI0033966680
MKKGLASILALLLSLTIAQSAFANGAEEASRGEFVKALLETLEVDVAHYAELDDNEFEDVPAELAPYVKAAGTLGITKGISNTTFGTNEKITREQAYVFLIRALNLADDYDVVVLNNYYDADNVSDWAKGELAAAIELGLLQGYLDHTLRPGRNLLTKHMDLLLARYDENFDRVSIVHTNDLHGRVLYNEENGEMGLAKIATKIEQVRSSNPDTFVFDMGDTFHGTNYVNLNEGQAAVEAMQLIGFDALVPGNHDFNFGRERLLEIAAETDFPIISANVVETETGETILPAYDIVTLGDKTFALIGVTAQDTVVKTHPANIEGLTFKAEAETIETYVKELQDEVDHILVLSHAGYDIDQQIAAQVDGIDLILGGHTHTTLEKPELHGQTYITQAYEHGKAFGVTHMLYFEDELIGVQGHLVRDSAALEPDQQVTDLLNEYVEEVEEAFSEVIGTIAVDLDGAREDVRTKETNLGNLITDAMRDVVDAEIAVTNGGGIRDNIAAGEVTFGDVNTAFPFPNFVIALELTGEQLLNSIEHSVSLYPEENGGFLQTSGLTYSFDPARPAGSRITEALVNGEPLQADAVYTVATNDFTAAGGDGYEWFMEANLVADTGEYLSTVLIDYIRAGKPIPEVENRIRVVE